MIRLFLFFVGLIGIANVILAQTPAQKSAAIKQPELLQLSGLIVTADSLMGLPLVSVGIKNTSKGTLSDEGGFFSLVVKKGDTIVFSFIGFRTTEYVVPADLKGIKYSIIQPLTEEGFELNTAVIRSYPTPDEFDYYFVKATIPDAYFEASTRNLRRKTLQEISSGMSMDGVENQRYTAQQQMYKYYYNGQLPPNRIFDPLAWGQFFEAWKRGDYKKKN